MIPEHTHKAMPRLMRGIARQGFGKVRKPFFQKGFPRFNNSFQATHRTIKTPARVGRAGVGCFIC